MISFGFLGAIAGFWLVAVYQQWRENELQNSSQQ
jgi:hypothetical protein